ncbi:MAG: CaiB/BaiF CoA transferase family protein [Rhizobiaceae bacterium]
MTERRSGPLAGLTIIEMAGIGPVPLAGLIFAEMGASVIRVERRGAPPGFIPLKPEHDVDRHGRAVLQLDLKRPEGVALLLRLCASADVLMEGFRPGVMERLGLGPEAVLAANPRIIYGRMTGFGQDGPLALRAGHDINYLAMSGLLHAMGNAEGRPVPPLNLVADYGGGTMFLVAGVLATLFEAGRSGKGQVVDAAMVDGVGLLASLTFALLSGGLWSDRRGVNLLDSGAPFYDTYETADGRHIAVGCLEPQFFAEFARLLPLDASFIAAQYDRSRWPQMRAAIAARVKEKTRDEWQALFESTDACVSPVLSMREAPEHPHNRGRKSHSTQGGLLRAEPAPRFSRTQGERSAPLDETAADILARFGVSADETAALAKEGIVSH